MTSGAFRDTLIFMRLILIKDGERRLSRPRDLALLFTTVADFFSSANPA
jgi:hypothetical protein